MFDQAFQYWETPDFKPYCLAQLKAFVDELPLGQCCMHSSVIDPESVSFRMISTQRQDTSIGLKIGVFFEELLSGCACSDDPSQAMIRENGYCEMQLLITGSGQVEVFIDA